MKKFSLGTRTFSLSTFCLMMILSLFCTLSLSSCSDDDDEPGGSSVSASDANLVGFWHISSIKFVDEEETWTEDFDDQRYYIRLTLKEDHTYSEVTHIAADGDEEEYNNTETGTWEVTGSKLILTESNGYFYSEWEIKTLTTSSLVLYQSGTEDGIYEAQTRTYVKVNLF